MAPVAVQQDEGEMSVASNKRLKASSERKAAVPVRRRQRLFQPFRALGLITDHVPFVLSIRHGGKDASRPDVNLISCIGTSWTMWDAERMTLLFVGEPLEAAITSLCIVGGTGGKDSIFATSGSKVYRFQRGKLVDTYVTHESGVGVGAYGEEEKGILKELLLVGDSLLAISTSGQSLYVWSVAKRSLLRRVDLNRPFLDSEGTFSSTAMLHPSTYIDKVLLGSRTGHLQLYNFRTSTLLHTFSRQSLLAYMGMEETSLEYDESLLVVDLVQTPAIDVVAVAFASGHILLLDIRYDEPIMCAHIARGAVASGNILAKGCLTFRTDGMAHTMAVGTQLGDVILFDLQANPSEGPANRARPAQLAHRIRSAHDAAIASVQFVQGQPLLISSGSDNAIKQWFFEVNAITGGGNLGGEAAVGSTTVPRLLKSREGHSAPPRLIRFVGEDGKTIISTGGDDRSVRAMSIVRDSRSAEMSQGSLKKKSSQISKPLISLKLPPTTSLSHSSTRSRDWDDLISTHAGSSQAEVWSVRNQRMGRHQLAATALEKTNYLGEATTTCMSACGNFALIGNSLGFIEMYNIQSGRHRRRLDTRTEKVEKVQRKLKSGGLVWREAKSREKGSAVTGIVSDLTNRFVMASTSGGGLYFFDFHTGSLLQQINTGVGTSLLLLDRSTHLAAAVQDDLTIKLYDIETYKMVRVFGGFAAKVLDATFSPDGKWLIASSLDGFVRTFDIPTSRLVDYFKTEQVATSVTFSPVGDFLATTHMGSKGIYLWANRNQYLNLALSGIDEGEVLQKDASGIEALPTLRGVDVDELAEEDERLKEIDVGEGEFQRTYTSKPQLFIESSEGDDAPMGLITLSTMPRSRWMTLLNLDIIKARNRPKEAPKKPERAPFFLPVGASSIPESAIKRPGLMSMGEEEEYDEDMQGDAQMAESRRLQTFSTVGLDLESDLARRLRLALDEDQLDSLFIYLHSLTPPALDSDIRSLVKPADVTLLLRCMTARLRQHLDYDAIQAMIAVSLKIHSSLIIENGVKTVAGQEDDEEEEEGGSEDEAKELGDALRELMIEQYREGNRVLELLQHCVGSLAFVRDLPLS